MGIRLFILFLFFLNWINVVNSDEGAYLYEVLMSRMQHMETDIWTPITLNPISSDHGGDTEDDLIANGLPGQLSIVPFRQYSGYITVDELNGRSLFYYFAEAHPSSTPQPLILWLNGGPGCSSLGIGAMVENGPFGVREDGETLYLRQYAWNMFANMLYLESPAGVGFSYSNTTSDYNSTGDSRTARDSYIFLVKWFEKFPQYLTSEFYIAGESYTGHYAPELADTILQNMHAHPREIQLKGIMVGNGVMDKVTDSRGMIDYWRSHALISSNTHQELMKFCSGQWSVTCPGLWSKVRDEVGALDLYSLSSETEACTDLHRSKCDDGFDPCDKSYVTKYLNLQHVQESLHVNKMIYPWQICSLVAEAWRDSPPTMLPIYKKLIAAGLRILLYSGDMDGVIPWTSTQYSINSLNLTMKKPWRVWMDVENKVGGHMEEYNGLTFAVVRGAGHEVPKYQPRKAFSLIKWFLKS